MTPIPFRLGAALCAVVLPVFLAGCGETRSLLGPRDMRPAAPPALAGADINPGTAVAGPPALTFYGSGFRYTSPAGGYSIDPSTWVPLEVAAGQAVTVNWFARVRGGARVVAYDWALDIEDVFDRTPRLDEATDLAHWSRPSLTTVSATVGPFAPGEGHLLYVEVTDSHGLRSLGIVHLEVVEALPENAALR